MISRRPPLRYPIAYATTPRRRCQPLPRRRRSQPALAGRTVAALAKFPHRCGPLGQEQRAQPGTSRQCRASIRDAGRHSRPGARQGRWHRRRRLSHHRRSDPDLRRRTRSRYADCREDVDAADGDRGALSPSAHDQTGTRPNQVWAMDITYIQMARGFVYLPRANCPWSGR